MIAELAPADRRRMVTPDEDAIGEDFDGLAVLDELALAVRGLVAACRRDTWQTLRDSNWSVQRIADHWAVTDKAVYKVLSRSREQRSRDRTARRFEKGLPADTVPRMPVIRWENPGPEPYTDYDRWAHETAAELRARPGEWAVVLECDSGAEAQPYLYALIEHRDHTGRVWPAGRWKAGTFTAYACWSKARPEASNKSATVYELTPAGSRDEIDEPGDHDTTSAESSKPERNPRWWRRPRGKTT